MKLLIALPIFVPKIIIYENYLTIWPNKKLKSLIINKKIAHKKFKINGLYNNYVVFQIFINNVRL